MCNTKSTPNFTLEAMEQATSLLSDTLHQVNTPLLDLLFDLAEYNIHPISPIKVKTLHTYVHKFLELYLTRCPDEDAASVLDTDEIYDTTNNLRVLSAGLIRMCNYLGLTDKASKLAELVDELILAYETFGMVLSQMDDEVAECCCDDYDYDCDCDDDDDDYNDDDCDCDCDNCASQRNPDTPHDCNRSDGDAHCNNCRCHSGEEKQTNEPEKKNSEQSKDEMLAKCLADFIELLMKSPDDTNKEFDNTPKKNETKPEPKPEIKRPVNDSIHDNKITDEDLLMLWRLFGFNHADFPKIHRGIPPRIMRGWRI